MLDEERACAAAQHVFQKSPEAIRERLEALREFGVVDEQTLADHALDVLTASDTQCFRGAFGRECYANDRLNTIVHTLDGRPEKNTVYYNNAVDSEPHRTATARLAKMAERERDWYQVPCEIRTGGSQALDWDRMPEKQAAHVRSEDTRAGKPAESLSEAEYFARAIDDPESYPPLSDTMGELIDEQRQIEAIDAALSRREGRTTAASEEAQAERLRDRADLYLKQHGQQQQM